MQFNFPTSSKHGCRVYANCMTSAAFIIKNPTDPKISATCSACIIKSRSARTHLRKIWFFWRDFCKPQPWCMWRKRSNSQFQMTNHRDWGIMGYNDVTVSITLINLKDTFFFIGLDRSRLTNLDRSDFWLWTRPLLELGCSILGLSSARRCSSRWCCSRAVCWSPRTVDCFTTSTSRMRLCRLSYRLRRLTTFNCRQST